MSTNIDDAFGGGGAKSAFGKVVQIGQTIGGPIVSAEMRQAAEFDRDGKPTGKLRTWDNGDPILELLIITRTSQRDPDDPDDDGRRAHRVKNWGDDKRRFVDAVQAAGFQKVSDAVKPGNEFWQKLVDLTGPPGSILRRDYEYRIIPGTAGGIDQAMSQQPQQPAQQPPTQGHVPQQPPTQAGGYTAQPVATPPAQQPTWGPPAGQPGGYPAQPAQQPYAQPAQPQQPGTYPAPGGVGEPPF